MCKYNRNPNVVLICGVDVVNSSSAKMDDPRGWYPKHLLFFSTFERALRSADEDDRDSSPDGWNLWRVVGDELIYYRVFTVDILHEKFEHLNDISKEVTRYVNQFNKVLSFVMKDLDINLHGYAFIIEEIIGDSSLGDFMFNFTPREYVEEYSADPVAYIDSLIKNHKGNIDNIKVKNFVDFMGRGVDQGFRMSEHSTVTRFVLSPKLAYCLCISEESEIAGNIHFLGFQYLKGCGNIKYDFDRFPVFYLQNTDKMNNGTSEYYRSIQLSVENIKNSAKEFIDFELQIYNDTVKNIESASPIDVVDEVAIDSGERLDANDVEYDTHDG